MPPFAAFGTVNPSALASRFSMTSSAPPPIPISLLSRFPEHELAGISPKGTAAKRVRGYGEAGDELALEIFTQQ
ncbi:MAG: hypothetical protein WA895_21325, partial [Streptosporangiaceae bacterium]